MRWMTGDVFNVAHRLDTKTVGFSANGTLDNRGRLVMGFGAALSVRNQFPSVDLQLGKALGDGAISTVVQPPYYLATVQTDGWTVHAVQVKSHWKDPGDLAMTLQSLYRLRDWQREHEVPVVINCPLIGAGGYGHAFAEVSRLVETALGHADITVCTLQSAGKDKKPW